MDLLFIVLLVVIVASAILYWWFFMKKKSGSNRVDIQDGAPVSNVSGDEAADTVVTKEPASLESKSAEDSSASVSLDAEDDGGSESTKS